MNLKQGITILMGLFLSLNTLYSQLLEIRGNGQLIVSDGSNLPALNDGTDFGSLTIGQEATSTFTLTSLELERPDIRIVSIEVNSADFRIEARRNIRIGPGRSRNFDVVYAPQSGGNHYAMITVVARRSGEFITYYFNIQGQSLIDLMISQSLENGSSDLLEITNLSDSPVSDGDYYVGIFNRRQDLRSRPSQVLDVGSIGAGETVLIGPRDLFDGDEVVVLSSSSGNRCYEDRVDQIGEHGQDWGSDRSLAKGACSSETAHLEFDTSHWTVLSLEEVNASINGQNIALGRYDRNPLLWDGTSWSNSGYPDKTREVILNGDFQGDLGNLEACHLEVNADLDYDKGTTNSVVLHGNLTVSGSFRIGDQESLVMFDPIAEIHGAISKIEKSTFRNNKHDFTYWSSSVQSASLNQVFAGVNPNRIYYFDQSQTQSNDPDDPSYWNSWQLGSGTMTTALGYAAEGVQGTTGIHEIEFTGTPNNGDVSVQVHHWDDENPDNDWNLLGNPYPSAIDIEQFFDANAGLLEPVVYLWTHTTPLSESGDYAFDDYATYNYTGGTGIGSGVGDGPIPEKNMGSAQGFFIRALTSGNAIFSNEMRLVGQNDQFFKPERIKYRTAPEDEKDRVWLNLKNDQGGFNQLLIGFLEQAGPGFDPGYDAKRFEGGNPISFYSTFGNDKFVIQAREPFSRNISIPLGFTSQVAPRIFSIEIAKAEGILRSEKIFIRDLELGILHDLSAGPYKFHVKKSGDQSNRFQLEFEKNLEVPILQEYSESKEWVVYAQNERGFVRSSETIEQIRVYNLMGTLVHQSYPNKKHFEFPLIGVRKGEILLVDVFDKKGGKLSKKIYNSSPHL